MQTGARADIQGLRALAVIVVILFHAGAPLSGGFVGVDMFFVISGFVITAMLMREWERDGSISLKTFYLRRAKRLTPALALVVGVTCIVSSLLLSPFDQQEQAAQTGLGALALVANWVIAAHTGDYFGPTAETNPMLHMWSLSVEEQFYLAFPVSLLVAWRVGRRFGQARLAALLLVCTVGVASLGMVRGASLGIPPDSWVLGYYSPFNRAWEFAAGAALALVAHRLPCRKSLASIVGISGALLLTASLVLIDAETLFPGKWTLVPVAGATLCLAAGSMHSDNLVSRAFSVRPAVAVGDRSYSLYLWHWPCIVVGITLFPLSPGVAPIAAIVSVIPAVASYAWVEKPFRAMTLVPARRVVTMVGAVSLGTAGLAFATWSVAALVWQPAYQTGAVGVAHPAPSERPGAEQTGVPCSWETLTSYINGNGLCRQSRTADSVDVLLLGDSHAEHLFPGVVRSLPSGNVAVVSFRAPMMFGSRVGLDLALDVIVSSRPPLVLVSRKWSSGPMAERDQFQPLDYAVRRLSSAGMEVVLVDDVPEFPFPVEACSYRLAPIVATSMCHQPRARVTATRAGYLPELRAVAARHFGTRVVEIGTTLCDERTCSMLAGDDVAYSDSDHLDAAGSSVFAERLVDELGRSITGLR